MFCLDHRYEGRVYQAGLALIEICCLGASMAVIEVTEGGRSTMMEASIADCEINILSGKWIPATSQQVSLLSNQQLMSSAV